MNLQENISRIKEVMSLTQSNLYNKKNLTEEQSGEHTLEIGFWQSPLPNMVDTEILRKMAYHVVEKWKGKENPETGYDGGPPEQKKNESESQFSLRNIRTSSKIIFDFKNKKVYYDKSFAIDPKPLSMSPNMLGSFRDWFDKNNNFNPF